MNAGAKFVLLAPIVPLMLLVIVFAHSPWTVWRISGLILLLVSFLLLSLSRIQFGNSFSISPQARALVKHGIYAKLRHPVYVFSALLLLGVMVYLNLPGLLLLFVVLLPVQIMRARAEERTMEEKFGEEYAAYRRSTWF